MFENATLGSFEQIEVRFGLTSFPIIHNNEQHRQLAVKIANLSSEIRLSNRPNS